MAALAAGGIVVLVGALVVLGVVRSRDVPAIAERDPPLSYRLTYRVDEFRPGKPAGTRLQILSVRRPFDGRNQTSEDDGSEPAAIVSTIDRVWRLTSDGPEDLGPKAPSTAVGDARPLLAMGRAIHEGLAKQAGRARVRGRACTRYAVAQPPGKPLSAPGPIARTELCVDRRGLVLEEKVFSGRTLSRVRRAIEVEIDPDLPPEIFLAPRPRSGADATVHVRKLADDEAADPEPPAVRLPDGFTREGRWLVERTADGTRTLAAVWTRGPDLLIAETARGPAAPWPPAVQPVAVRRDGGAGAELVLDLVASQVRWTAGDAHRRVYGTLPVEQLLRAAGAARA